jgi:hypothetical protein
MRTLAVLALALAACSSNVVNNNGPPANPCEDFMYGPPDASGFPRHVVVHAVAEAGSFPPMGDWCCQNPDDLGRSDCVCRMLPGADPCPL